MRRTSCILLISVGLALPAFGHHVKVTNAKTMPVTTSSAKARDLYQRAMIDYENLYLERANVGWRAAVAADPNCALAWAWIAFNSRNPEEVRTAREKAKALEQKVTPGERLMIEWIANVQENNFIAGIAAMNDMLEMYPRDKDVLYLAGNWLMGENEYEPAQRMFEKALALDEDYPAALNDLGYTYARSRQFEKAFATMEHYIAVLPKEPNPHDSYAELLRMAGKYDAALEHYRAALRIDPDFVSSQLGLGDTKALMGDEAQARVEYDKAIQGAHTDADRLDYGLQKAMSWAREGNFADADKGFLSVAETGHHLGLEMEEAQAHRMMSMYQKDDGVALHHLELAEDALGHRTNLSVSDREEERARILRYRAARAAQAGNQELADKTLKQLQDMAEHSRSNTIQTSYHGAAGSVLVARQQYANAIEHLEEDRDNPCSLDLLGQAYEHTGASEKLHEAQADLLSTHVPTIEQAVVVLGGQARQAAK